MVHKSPLRGWRRRAADDRGGFPTVFTLFVAMRTVRPTGHDLRSLGRATASSTGSSPHFQEPEPAHRTGNPHRVLHSEGTPTSLRDIRYTTRETQMLERRPIRRAEGRMKMEPTIGRHTHDAILIPAGIFWPPGAVVETVTALTVVVCCSLISTWPNVA